MTKLSNAFGDKYKKNKNSMRTKTFEYGGHTFKVLIPLVGESDEIYKKIQNPSDELIETVYQEMINPLIEFKENSSEEIKFIEKDVLIQGKSMREAAKNKLIVEAKIVELIKLLVPESPEHNLNNLTYKDIECEFPLSVQLALIEKIGEIISPTYKEARGN